MRCTEQLVARMDAAAGTANAKVLLHPTTSPVVVQSREHVAIAVADFRITERARRRRGDGEKRDERR